MLVFKDKNYEFTHEKNEFIILIDGTLCDYLNLTPKGSKIVSNVEDVKAELLSYWSSSTYSSLPLTSYGNSSPLSLPFYNDINIQLAIYEDNMDMLAFKDHKDVNV